MTVKRMAVVMPRFPERGMVGGAETLLTDLARRAVGMGIAVEIFTTCSIDHVTWHNTLPPGTQTRDGLTIHYFPVDPRGDTTRFDRIQAAISAGRTLSAEEERFWTDHNVDSTPLREALAARGDAFDRILTGPYLFGLTLHTAARHPHRTILIPCLHDEPFARLQAVRTMFEQVRTVMFNTEPERELAVRLYSLADMRTAVTGMGLKPFTVQPGTFRQAHNLNTPYLLYCGRREPLKGTPLLLAYIDTFRLRTGRDVKLVLTGSGPIEPPTTLAPHILDLGFVPAATKQEAMADCLAFCHPSTNESFGIVLLEAWLAGRPGLVHAGSPVLMDHCRRGGGGLWFDCYPEFEAQLELLLDQPALSDTLGRQGRHYVATHYSHAAIDDRLATALAR